jgi:D-3-phosphoglycerate dehydrogenase
VAGYGKAFGMKVLVWGSEGSRSRAQAESDGHTAAESREQLFAESDVLSLHLRLNAETFGIVKLEDLAA